MLQLLEGFEQWSGRAEQPGAAVQRVSVSGISQRLRGSESGIAERVKVQGTVCSLSHEVDVKQMDSINHPNTVDSGNVFSNVHLPVVSRDHFELRSMSFHLQILHVEGFTSEATLNMEKLKNTIEGLS